MTLAGVFVFLIPALIGGLAAHLLWPDRKGPALLLKLSLGVGAGLGISSILYFFILSFAPGAISMGPIQVVLLAVLSLLIFLRERKEKWQLAWPRLPTLSRLQSIFLIAVIAALIFSSLTFVNRTEARPQGAFDAWSIWNRAARFIYRDPENWRATLSPELYWGTHPDYPLLVPLNVAWGWETLGTETPRIPMLQSGFFFIACIGLMFAAVGLARSTVQASLAALALMGAPVFLSAAPGLISDVPVTFFIFAASVLMYFYFVYRKPALLMLAGFMAGLAAWTKNEGLLFVAASTFALLLVSRKNILRDLPPYFAGLALPIAVVLYFKIALAPPGDLFTDGAAQMAARLSDPARYWVLLKALLMQLPSFGSWPAGILIPLAVYALILRFDLPSQPPEGLRVVLAVLLFQFLGYCLIYVMSPHDLAWHLATSLTRILLQIYPTAIFLFFCAVPEPERYFSKTPAEMK
jgi:hypothetical protein